MGNRSHSGSKPKPLIPTSPSGEEQGSCTHFEAHFLNLLDTDINRAGERVGEIRRKILHCQDEHEIEAHRALGMRLQARYHEARSDHRTAIRLVRRALKLYRAIHDQAGIWLCYRLLFSAYAHLGNYRAARQQAELALSSDLPDSERLKFLGNLGGLEFRVHHHNQALQHYEAALKILDKLPNPRTEAITRYNLGNVFLYLNRFGEAEAHYQLAQECFLHEGLVLYRAHALQSFGILYVILGQYFHAENRLIEARQLYLEAGDRFGAALCDLELLHMLVRLNRWDQASELAHSLADTCRKLGRRSELGLVHFHSAEIAIATEDDTLAREFIDHAMRLFSRENNEIYLARCRMMKALILHRAQASHRGIVLLKQAQSIFQQKNAAELETECIALLWLLSDRKLDEANVSRLQFLLRQPISPHTRTQALVALSECLDQKGKRDQAVRLLFEAINAVEESRASIISLKQRESFFANKAQLYERLIEKLFNWRSPKAPALIFKVMELSRARQMAEQLSQRESLPPVLNKNEPMILELRKHELRLKQLNQRLEDFSIDAQTSEQDRQHLVEQIAQLRNDKDKLAEMMGNETRLSLFFPIPLDIERIRENLAKDELLVIYFITEQQLYRLELGKTILRTYKLELYQEFDRDFNLLSNILAYRLLPKMDQVPLLAAKISALLTPENLDGIRNITFVPHKQLQRFPFSLLTRGEKLLLADYQLQICPNVPVFHIVRQKKTQAFRRPVLFFSDFPQDPRARERESLLALFPAAVHFDRLTHPQVVEKLRDSDFIHFAGHCYFNPRNPDTSYLQLQGERVFLPDFGRIHLNSSPFINLAACQSGWMAMGSGNEPYGFVITAFAAGASSILSTLWEVDDEATGSWMNCFYQNMDKGLAEAYRIACLNTALAHPEPYFWAGFSLIGRGSYDEDPNP